MTSAVSIHRDLTGLCRDTHFSLETLIVTHGNATTLWKEFGDPKNFTREQSCQLSAFTGKLKTQTFVSDHTGSLQLHLVHEPWNFVFLSETGG